MFCEAWLSAWLLDSEILAFNHHAITCVTANSQGSKDLTTQGIFSTTYDVAKINLLSQVVMLLKVAKDLQAYVSFLHSIS